MDNIQSLENSSLNDQEAAVLSQLKAGTDVEAVTLETSDNNTNAQTQEAISETNAVNEANQEAAQDDVQLSDINANAEPLDELMAASEELATKEQEAKEKASENYSFKPPEGEEQLYNTLAQKAQELNLSDEQYTKFVEHADAIYEQFAEQQNQEVKEKLNQEFIELKKEFGAETTKNVNLINQALKDYGLKQADFYALSDAVGMKTISKMLIASKRSNSDGDLPSSIGNSSLSSGDINAKIQALAIQHSKAKNHTEKINIEKQMIRLEELKSNAI